MNDEVKSGNAIVDMTLEDFKRVIKDFDRGVLKGTENVLTVMFNNLQDIRNRLMNISMTDEVVKLLKDTYAKMNDLELKIFALRDEQKDRDKQVEEKFKTLKGS